MSGSNSSARGAEPLTLTVHSVAAPDPRQAQVRSGRLRMLLVLLVCAAPVVASYLAYFVVRPTARSNYGGFIEPVRALPADLRLTRLDGTPVAAAALRGQWLLVAVAPAACGAACERQLYMQRQLREMLGRDRDRLDKVWLVADGGTPAPALRAALEAPPATTILHADPAALARWLVPAPGHALADHLYVVDPMGDWMMRMPADADPAKVKRDLDRLLRASAGWDRPGR